MNDVFDDDHMDDASFPGRPTTEVDEHEDEVVEEKAEGIIVDVMEKEEEEKGDVVFEETAEEIIVDHSDEEKEEDENLEETVVEERKENSSFAEVSLKEKVFEEREVVEVFMEAEAGDIEGEDNHLGSDEKKAEDDIEDKESLGEDDKTMDETEMEVAAGEEEEAEDEEDEWVEREETDITGTQVDQKIQVEESFEENIDSSISVDIRVRENVSIKEEIIRKSTQAPKIEKVESMIGESAVELDSMKKKRTFRKFSYRGVNLDQLLDLSLTQAIGHPIP